jgi:hypothetical protein
VLKELKVLDKDQEKRQEQERRIKQLRLKYVAQARRQMSPQTMHEQLRGEEIQPPLTDQQIESIVTYAYHPFNNPNNELKDWSIDSWPGHPMLTCRAPI